MPRRLRLASSIVLAAVSVPIVLTSLAGLAAAHAELISSDPADGATVATRPGAVTLTFGEAIDPKTARSRVEVRGEGGFSYSFDLRPRVEGTVVRISLGQTNSAGRYTVTYRVVSEDGHPVEGSLAFRAADRVATPVDPGDSSSADASAPPPAGEMTGAQATAPQATAPQTTAPQATAPQTTASGVAPFDDVDPAWLYAFGGVAILGAAGTAIALFLRYRSP